MNKKQLIGLTLIVLGGVAVYADSAKHTEVVQTIEREVAKAKGSLSYSSIDTSLFSNEIVIHDLKLADSTVSRSLESKDRFISAKRVELDIAEDLYESFQSADLTANEGGYQFVVDDLEIPLQIFDSRRRGSVKVETATLNFDVFDTETGLFEIDWAGENFELPKDLFKGPDFRVMDTVYVGEFHYEGKAYRQGRPSGEREWSSLSLENVRLPVIEPVLIGKNLQVAEWWGPHRELNLHVATEFSEGEGTLSVDVALSDFGESELEIEIAFDEGPNPLGFGSFSPNRLVGPDVKLKEARLGIEDDGLSVVADFLVASFAKSRKEPDIDKAREQMFMQLERDRNKYMERGADNMAEWRRATLEFVRDPGSVEISLEPVDETQNSLSRLGEAGALGTLGSSAESGFKLTFDVD